MAQVGEKAAVLHRWAACKFAGEDLGQEIVWDAAEPDATDAACDLPTAGKPGRIQLRRTCSDGVDKVFADHGMHGAR